MDDINWRAAAVSLFNEAWSYIDLEARSQDEERMMLATALGSLACWRKVGNEKNFSISDWQVSRVYALIGDAGQARIYGESALRVAETGTLEPFYVGFAYEALARAALVAGDASLARRVTLPRRRPGLATWSTNATAICSTPLWRNSSHFFSERRRQASPKTRSYNRIRTVQESQWLNKLAVNYSSAGSSIPPAAKKSGENVLYDADDLTTHGVIIGMTGAGKTGLGVVALEEALLFQEPCVEDLLADWRDRNRLSKTGAKPRPRKPPMQRSPA